MDEKWSTIKDFPAYKISTNGEIVNRDTNRNIKLSTNKAGIVKVGLVYDGTQYTRAVSVLVAEAFVFGRDEKFNTPIHLDGNALNNRADNILWRPRWFAWKYARQFTEVTIYNAQGPILDLKTGVWYTDMMEAATENGLLVDEIRRSVIFRRPVFPTKQIFTFQE